MAVAAMIDPVSASRLTTGLSLRLLCGALGSAVGVLSLIPISSGTGGLISGVSRLAAEFGYCLIIPSMIALLPRWRGSSAGRLTGVLNVFAIMLLATPPARAWETSQSLPEMFVTALGPETRTRHRYADERREVPFMVTGLVRPTPSRPVRHERRVISGAGGADVTLDIYRPAYVHEPIPAVIIMHGETSGGVERELVALNGYLAARDYLVIAMSNPLRTGRTFKAAREDLLITIDYVKAHASELKLDATRLALMGRSVAGHLPLLVAYTAHDPSIRGVIAFYAPSDFASWYAHAQPGGDVDTREIIGNYLGSPNEPALDVLDSASPIRSIRHGAPPTLLVHGLRDHLVPVDQSERLAARLEQADVRHVLVRLPWASHVCDLNFVGPCGQITTYAVERFLDGVMSPSATRADGRDPTDREINLQTG